MIIENNKKMGRKKSPIIPVIIKLKTKNKGTKCRKGTDILRYLKDGITQRPFLKLCLQNEGKSDRA